MAEAQLAHSSARHRERMSEEHEEQQTWGAPPVAGPRRWTARTTAVAAAVGIGVAGASGLAVWAGTSADSGGEDRSGGMPGMPGGPNGMPEGMPDRSGGTGGGSADALHSESVVEVDGGYETRLTQTGSVTSAAADSVTVRSADDHTASYAIDSDTAVTGGSGELAEGETVTVTATREGETAVATTIESSRSRGGPPARRDGGGNGEGSGDGDGDGDGSGDRGGADVVPPG